ncbi:MAG: heparinase II/III family protein [Puniceicoccaceae bacterium]
MLNLPRFSLRQPLAALLLAIALAWAAASSSQAQIADHPRLLFTDAVVDRIQTLSSTDSLLAEIIQIVEEEAVSGLSEPIIQRRLDDPSNPEKRMKDERRAAMYRLLNMGVTRRLTDDPDLAQTLTDRIRDELLAASGFDNFYPQHFLNIGEMGAVMGILYDWIYHDLTPSERSTIVAGIKKNILLEGKGAYDRNDDWWVTRNNNWNQVCNAGLTLSALAVYEDEPALAQEIIDRAKASILYSLVDFDPDGAWEEGPTYWAYGATYNALLFDALGTALGDFQGLENAPGFEGFGKSGGFLVQTVGPTNLYFNFGDAKTVAYFSPVLFWLAQSFDIPAYAFYQRSVVASDIPRMKSGQLMQDDTLDRFLALLVVWYDESGKALTQDDFPLNQYFRGSASVAAMRSSWDLEEGPIYLGLKGGDNQAAHGHLDIGSFVLDARGQRWAYDLGLGNYALPNYFDHSPNGLRWNYLRTRNHGHNTLTLEGLNQNVYARTPVRTFETQRDLSYAVIDMTPAYTASASSVERGFALLERNRVMIEDKVIGLTPGADFRWNMATAAAIALDGATATLTQGGETLIAEILEPAGAVFSVESAQPADWPGSHPLERPNPGIQFLVVNQNAPSGGTIHQTILLTPVFPNSNPLPVPLFRPLTQEQGLAAPPNLSFPVQQTAFVRDGTANAGSNQMSGTTAHELRVKKSGAADDGFNRETYLSFNIPEGLSPAHRAELVLNPTRTIDALVEVASTATNWTDSTITWNNRPSSGPSFFDFRPFVNLPVRVPITELLNQALEDPTIDALGFHLYSEEFTVDTVRIASRFHPDANLHPRVEIFAAPEFSVEVLEPTAEEFGLKPAKIRVHRTDLSSAVEVQYSLGGSAIPGQDIDFGGDTLSFGSGVQYIDLDVYPLSDDQPRGERTLEFFLVPGSGYRVGSQNLASLTIQDLPFNHWRHSLGLSGTSDQASYQRALLSYALGLNLDQNLAPHSPHIVPTSSGHFLQFVTPNPTPIDIHYSILQSNQLGSWEDFEESFSSTPSGEGYQVWTAPVPPTEDPIFFTLEVHQLVQ